MVRLLLAICLLIEGTSFFFYNKILFTSHKSWIGKVLTYFISYLLLFVFHGFSSYRNIALNIALFFAVNIFILLFLYKLEVLSALLHSLMLSAFSIISEVFVGTAINKALGHYWNNWNDANILMLITPSVFIYSVFVIAAAYIEKKVRALTKMKIMAIPLSLLSILAFILILINYSHFH